MTNPVTVKVKTEVNFKPFATPNFVNVLGSDGSVERPIPVKDASQEVLDELAAHWLDSLYDSAGKRNGWKRPVWR